MDSNVQMPFGQKSESHIRNFGVDLARVIAMYLVVLLHFTVFGIGQSEPTQMHYLATRAFHAAGIVSVDIFAIVSGYVGVTSRFRISRLVSLWMQVLFTGVVVLGTISVFNLAPVTPENWRQALLPIGGCEYWYFTAYACVFVLSPFLNAGLRAVSRAECWSAVGVAFLMLSFGQTIGGYGYFLLNDGFSPLWLVFCYVLGGALRLHLHRVPKVWWLLTGIMMMLVVNFITLTFSGKGWCRPFGIYTSPNVVICAALVVLLFAQFKIGPRAQKILRWMTPLTFGVYLWHLQPVFWNSIWMPRWAALSADWSVPTLVAAGLVVPPILMLFMMLIDSIRQFLFNSFVSLFKGDKESRQFILV